MTYSNVDFARLGFSGIRHSLIEVTKHNTNTSPLLRLPAELRNQIWEYAVGGMFIKIDQEYHGNDNIPEIRASLLEGNNKSSAAAVFSLAKVCRQTYVETIAILYSHNVFVIGRLAMKEWQAMLSPAQRRLVAHIDVRDAHYYAPCGNRCSVCDRFSIVANPHLALPGLKTITMSKRQVITMGNVERAALVSEGDVEQTIRRMEGAHVQIHFKH